MSKWRVVVNYGMFLICAPGCELVRPLGNQYVFVKHADPCEITSCGRVAETLSEAFGFVDVEACLQGANMEVSA